MADRMADRMAEAIINTSPLLYLYRIGVLDWLPKLFSGIWTSNAVANELKEGEQKGYDVPNPSAYDWLTIVEPRALPSEWLSLDLGAGELAVMALALENPDRIVILDDALARRTANAAGIAVWGTLKILLQAKRHGLTEKIGPLVHRLEKTGMWLSDDIRQSDFDAV